MKLQPFESINGAGEPVVRFSDNSDDGRAEAARFAADVGLKPDWQRLSGPMTGTINGKRVQLWDLPAAKADGGV